MLLKIAAHWRNTKLSDVTVDGLAANSAVLTRSISAAEALKLELENIGLITFPPGLLGIERQA